MAEAIVKTIERNCVFRPIVITKIGIVIARIGSS
jgi:hypothetical protein